MDSRGRLTRALLIVILVAALATAPFFLFAEKFDRTHLVRVLASNGVVVALCAVLLGLLRKGKVTLVARVLVFGLLALVSALASTNGEAVHINVVNFVLVTVLASALLSRRELVAVACASAVVMSAIAWNQAVAVAGTELAEVRFESIIQFLPTYAVIVAVLWLAKAAT